MDAAPKKVGVGHMDAAVAVDDASVKSSVSNIDGFKVFEEGAGLTADHSSYARQIVLWWQRECVVVDQNTRVFRLLGETARSKQMTQLLLGVGCRPWHKRGEKFGKTDSGRRAIMAAGELCDGGRKAGGAREEGWRGGGG